MKSLKKLCTKKYLTTFFFSFIILASFAAPLQIALAQTTGDSIVKCGQGTSTTSACKIDREDFGGLVKGVLTLVLSIGLPLLFIFVAYRFVMAWFSLQQGNANAYKEALQKAGNAILGFLIVVVLIGGGLYTILSVFGVKSEYIQILKLFSEGGYFTHTFAQTTQFDNPVPGVSNLYDFILKALSLVMKFFIYPALIVIWVWTGFSFVLAQGAPEALTKAKKWLMWAFITTLVIMVLQGFLFALRATVQKILPGQTTTPTSNYSNEGNNYQPVNINNVNYSNEGNNAPANPANYGNEGNNYPVPPQTPVEQSGNNGNN